MGNTFMAGSIHSFERWIDMPWKVETSMSLRSEFVELAIMADANMALLCRRFGISRKTGYKWIARRALNPGRPLEDVSRRPRRSPARTVDEVEQKVIALRRQHPAWGARKLKRRLEDQGAADIPARSTVNDILRRHGLIDPAETNKHSPMRRFERAAPNELWQMDFKGDVVTASGRCHPLTVLDDHSRYNIVLKACEDQQTQTVKVALTSAMRLYGMPVSILSDNGPPFGSFNRASYITELGAWLIRCGVSIIHGRPLHPQTQGKEERFHRTLKAEAIGSRVFTDIHHCQQAFDQWRPIYNHQRPHEALDMNVPATRYCPSQRSFPEKLPSIEYGPNDSVRKVCSAGKISYAGRLHLVGSAFEGQFVAIRPTATDANLEVFYCHQRIAKIDLRDESESL
jgi:transposase InsO family protein